MSDYQQSGRQRKHSQPLNPERLRSLALGYVGRYATSCGRLRTYLGRKVGEFGWNDDGEPPIDDIVAQFVTLGYVDDEAFAASRAASLLRRGYGPARLRVSLRAAGIAREDADHAAKIDAATAWDAALAFARRKRFGPYAKNEASAALHPKIIASFLRAGHSYDVSRKILALTALDIVASSQPPLVKGL